MWTKICGTTSLDDAQLAAELGADAIGFVFAQSKRQVSPEQVAAITPQLPSMVEKVGVFDRPDLPVILHAVQEAGLSAVQLHFALDPVLLDDLVSAFEGRIRLIQVIGVAADASGAGSGREAFAAALGKAFARSELFAVLLDTVQGTRSGGTGKTFAWSEVADVVATAREEAQKRAVGPGSAPPHLLLAGGLSVENVATAVHALNPWGVDVVSGVEARPGVKSPERVSRFLQSTRALSKSQPAS